MINDDLTLEVPGYDYEDTSMIEVSNIENGPKEIECNLTCKKHMKWS